MQPPRKVTVADVIAYHEALDDFQKQDDRLRELRSAELENARELLLHHVESQIELNKGFSIQVEQKMIHSAGSLQSVDGAVKLSIFRPVEEGNFCCEQTDE